MQQGLAHVVSDLEILLASACGVRTFAKRPLTWGFGYTNSIAGELLAHCCVFWAQGNAFLDLFLERKYWIIFQQPKPGFLKYIFIYLIWPNLVLLAAHGILDLHCSMRTLSLGMWDLVPWPGIQPRPPAMGSWRLSLWAIGKVSAKACFDVTALSRAWPRGCTGTLSPELSLGYHTWAPVRQLLHPFPLAAALAPGGIYPSLGPLLSCHSWQWLLEMDECSENPAVSQREPVPHLSLELGMAGWSLCF